MKHMEDDVLLDDADFSQLDVEEEGKAKVGMSQFMKAYATKFTDLVSTTRMAAERMAPLLRG